MYDKYIDEAEPEKVSAQLRRTFDVGTFWHEYLQNILLDMKFVEQDGIEQYHIQKIVTKRGPAYGSGKGDLVGVAIPGHGKWLIDIKSMKAADFRERPPDYLWNKYVAQINLYGDWFGYDKLMILGVEKDSPHRLREWIIHPDHYLIEAIYDKWTLVAQCLRTKVSPSDLTE